MRRLRRTWVVGALLLAACGSELSGPASHDARDGDDGGEVAPDIVEPDIPEVKVETSAPDDVTPDGDDVADVDDGDDADVADTAQSDGDDAADTTPDVPTTWRSQLYPEDWTPGFALGDHAALQDYSYAGYHGGALALGDGLGGGGIGALPRFNVLTYGAVPVMVDGDPTKAVDSTAAFQAAIDAATAAGGGVVWVPAGLYRIDTWLEVKASRVVIKGAGAELTKLWFTRTIGMSFEAHLRFEGDEESDVWTPLVADGATFDDELWVEDTSTINVGEDVVISQEITPGFLSTRGMSELWGTLVGTRLPLYRRTIVGIDRSAYPHIVRLDVPLRGRVEVLGNARLERVSGLLHEVGVEDLAIANASSWSQAWSADQLAAIALSQVADAWVRNVRTFESPAAPTTGKGAGAHLQSNGILVVDSKRVTVADTDLALAQNRGQNDGFLFEVRRSNEVLIRDSSARGGRNNFVVGRGFGTSGVVLLRVSSSDGGEVPLGPEVDHAIPARSQLHTLTTGTLVDASFFEDGFDAINRDDPRYGTGQSATECVFWNYGGSEVISLQWGNGYVIGSLGRARVTTSPEVEGGIATAPEDWVEGVGAADRLWPSSLYEDQLARRLGDR